MNIYHLERQEQCHRDENAVVVVIADNETEARSRAADVCGSEGPNPWLSNRVDVRELGTAAADTYPGFVCIDYLEA